MRVRRGGTERRRRLGLIATRLEQATVISNTYVSREIRDASKYIR